ncbi:MAG: PilN domain-containing protein [Desulfobacteraceae bacterium]|uniref:PilN domain-containing protein n=1 Tax=Candidatus Desulfacyla euxinica TaxID=2841693 RepID=A0A8J6T5Z4_9DELT|nr:PilN domain-containing protein [Candidatus Desulfacyla euxinica]MBL6979278.1 PilN domain-containing protein [Desulfobacteraceae bacterium]
MIRINLLPYRAARKHENIRRQVSVYFLSVFCLLTLMIYSYMNLNNELVKLKGEETQLRKEMASYAKVTREIARIKSRTKEIQDKFNVIMNLEKQRSGPVRFLEEIAISVPIDRLWLTAISEKRGNLTLKGNAMDHDTVALFMTNLEKTKQITSVDLETTKLQNFPKYKLNTASFVLACKTVFQQDKPEAKPKKGKSRRRR